MQIKNFDTYLNESKDPELNEKFFNKVVQVLDKNKITYKILSTDRQKKNGTVRIKVTCGFFNKPINTFFTMDDIRHFDIKYFHEISDDNTKTDIKSPKNFYFSFYSTGAIQHEGTINYLATSRKNPVDGVEKFVDIMIDKIRRIYMGSIVLSDKFLEQFLQPSSGKSLDPEFIKSVCSDEAYDCILSFKNEHSDAYKHCSSQLLFFAFMCHINNDKLINVTGRKDTLLFLCFDDSPSIYMTVKIDYCIAQSFYGNMIKKISDKDIKVSYDVDMNFHGLSEYQSSIKKTLENPSNWKSVEELAEEQTTAIKLDNMGF